MVKKLLLVITTILVLIFSIISCTPSPTPAPTPATPSLTPSPAPAPSIESTVSVGPSKDNTLYESTDGSLSNGTGSHLFVGKTNSGSIRRAVIAFDFSGLIPAGSTIKSVTLKLYMSKTHAGVETVDLHRLLTDWGEGTSDASGNEGRGTTATSGDATWIHRNYKSELWQSPGGDYSATASAGISVSGRGTYTWGSTPQLVDDVQSWLDNPSSNAGWILIGNETRSQTTKRFDSKENGTDAFRPVLTVTFTSP